MKALLDHFRCPQTLVDFATVGEVSPKSGFFRFGQALCYGQSILGSPGATAGSHLSDLYKHVKTTGSTVGLPFDPSQIVDNLRLERYIGCGDTAKQTILSGESIRKTYYFLRPLLDVSIRKHLQRLFFRRWKELPFPCWPVDTTVEQILEKLLLLSMKAQGIERIPFIWFWPQGASSCALITHDVETRAGADFVLRLMDIDDGFKIKASFQIIPEGRYSVSRGFLDEIRTRGFEVNVHDLNHDGNIFDNREALLERAPSINRYVREYGSEGFRAGLMHRSAEWLKALDISYDMSFPNVAHLEPQRGGCCTVFPYYIDGILEIPLTTSQDYSVFHVLGTYSTDLWKKQIALIQERHGLVSFIVHPDYIKKPRAQDVYRDLLGHLTVLRDEENVWIPLPRDLNRWWRQRSQMRLIPQRNTWEIVGPGKERARLAYASCDGERLVYSFDESAGLRTQERCLSRLAAR
jgi:hypothetical protein